MKTQLIKTTLLLLISFTAYATPPQNIACAKNNVIKYYTSGEYEKDVEQVIQDAEKYLFKRIDENNHAIHPEKLAIILDIDDTSISNFNINKIDDFSNNQALIIKRYEKANSPAIKPVLRLYNEAISNGVDVFFITFRPKDVESYTITNLQNEGYNKWTGLYLPSNDDIKKPSREFKTETRKILTEQGYDIILNLGDQDSDIEGGYAEHTVKIPNPMYTSAATCEEKRCQTSTLPSHLKYI